jgi:hypothetical protein
MCVKTHKILFFTAVNVFKTENFGNSKKISKTHAKIVFDKCRIFYSYAESRYADCQSKLSMMGYLVHLQKLSPRMSLSGKSTLKAKMSYRMMRPVITPFSCKINHKGLLEIRMKNLISRFTVKSGGYLRWDNSLKRAGPSVPSFLSP